MYISGFILHVGGCSYTHFTLTKMWLEITFHFTVTYLLCYLNLWKFKQCPFNKLLRARWLDLVSWTSLRRKRKWPRHIVIMYNPQNLRALTSITLAWESAGVDAFMSDKNINIAWDRQFTHATFWGFYSRGNLYNGRESILVGKDPGHLALCLNQFCLHKFFHWVDGKFLGRHNKTINNIPDSLLLTVKNSCSGWTWWTKWKYITYW